jgi:hypothetical protein
MKRFMKISAGVVAVAAVFAGTAAFAAVPDATGTVHTCYNTKSGALRVTDAPKRKACTTHETPLDINQKGEPGPPGPAGTMTDQVLVQQNSFGVLTPFNGSTIVTSYQAGASHKYLVTATVSVATTTSGTSVECDMVQFPAQTTVDTAYAMLITGPNGQAVASLTLQSAIGIGIVQVICNPSHPSFYTDAQLTLLPVGSIAGP